MSLARLAVLAAALVLVSSAVFGQAPSPHALRQLDSLASASRTARVEMAACVAATGSTIDSLTPASYMGADSVTTYGTPGVPLCPRGVASVHTHLHGVVQPSARDRVTLAHSRAAYALLVVLTPAAWLLVRY